MPLTDIAIKSIKPNDKQQKHYDSRGLFLLVTTAGQRYWRLKYRFGGKEKALALGVYPDVSIATARKKRGDAREKLAVGIDPNESKKASKHAARIVATNSFELIAHGWMRLSRCCGI